MHSAYTFSILIAALLAVGVIAFAMRLSRHRGRSPRLRERFDPAAGRVARYPLGLTRAEVELRKRELRVAALEISSLTASGVFGDHPEAAPRYRAAARELTGVTEAAGQASRAPLRS